MDAALLWHNQFGLRDLDSCIDFGPVTCFMTCLEMLTTFTPSQTRKAHSIVKELDSRTDKYAASLMRKLSLFAKRSRQYVIQLLH